MGFSTSGLERCVLMCRELGLTEERKITYFNSSLNKKVSAFKRGKPMQSISTALFFSLSIISRSLKESVYLGNEILFW